MLRSLIIACGVMLLSVTGTLAGTPTLVFPFDLIDTSEEGEDNGERADQTARLKLIDKQLIDLLKADGRYEPVNTAGIDADIQKERPIYKCNGCEDGLGKKAGAKLAFVCTVQKVSNLILNINLYVRDVEAEKTLREMSVDLRGNTDETWTRGLRYLVKNRLFADEAGK
jgi:Protein of unknown function (DUF2380)